MVLLDIRFGHLLKTGENINKDFIWFDDDDRSWTTQSFQKQLAMVLVKADGFVSGWRLSWEKKIGLLNREKRGML